MSLYTLVTLYPNTIEIIAALERHTRLMLTFQILHLVVSLCLLRFFDFRVVPSYRTALLVKEKEVKINGREIVIKFCI